MTTPIEVHPNKRDFQRGETQQDPQTSNPRSTSVRSGKSNRGIPSPPIRRGYRNLRQTLQQARETYLRLSTLFLEMNPRSPLPKNNQKKGGRGMRISAVHRVCAMRHGEVTFSSPTSQAVLYSAGKSYIISVTPKNPGPTRFIKTRRDKTATLKVDAALVETSQFTALRSSASTHDANTPLSNYQAETFSFLFFFSSSSFSQRRREEIWMERASTVQRSGALCIWVKIEVNVGK